MDKIRVLIADDQTLITESFKVLLESRAEDITVVGIAKNGKEAVALVETTECGPPSSYATAIRRRRSSC
jgi:YesN/AraC family two-component response regulator